MKNVTDIWGQSCAILQSLLNADTYERWIAGIVPISLDGDTILLGVSNNVFGDWLNMNYRDLIASAVEKVTGQTLSVRFESGYGPAVQSTAEASEDREAPSPRPAAAGKRGRAGRKGAGDSSEWSAKYNRRFTFDTFVVGENSKFAHAACCAVASAPGTIYNPLFIHSSVGLGKTHLLQAVANQLHGQRPGVRIEYISSEEFSNRFIDALRNNAVTEFRRRYRHVDLLLIDDVQFFTGKESLQEEFFHTFNALYNGHKQIVLTCDRPPHEIGGLEKRLVSRFEWGLTADILAPDLETRMAILKKKQDDHSVKLDEDVLLFIAGKIRSNIRRLEGALIRLVSYASVTGTHVNREIAERLLAPVLDEEAGTPISVEQVQRTVAEFYDIRIADMTSKRRPQNIAQPRQVAMYLSRKLTDLSSPAIAERFSRNHATVLHAVSAVESRMTGNPEFRREIQVIERRIKG